MIKITTSPAYQRVNKKHITDFKYFTRPASKTTRHCDRMSGFFVLFKAI